MSEAIVIKQNTKKNIFYVAGTLVMSILFLWMVFLDYRPETGIWGLLCQSAVFYVLLKILFVVGALFCVYGAIYMMKRIKSGKAVLIVDQKGVTDNSSAAALGFIPWADINRIYMDRLMNNQFIELVLKDEEKYLTKMHGYKKFTALSNKKMGHQIVCITLNFTGVSPQAVFVKMQLLFEQAKQMGNLPDTQ